MCLKTFSLWPWLENYSVIKLCPVPGLSLGRCRCRILGKPENPNTVNKVLCGGLNLEATSLWRGPLEKNKGKTGAPRRLKLYLRVTAEEKCWEFCWRFRIFFLLLKLFKSKNRKLEKEWQENGAVTQLKCCRLNLNFFGSCEVVKTKK